MESKLKIKMQQDYIVSGREICHLIGAVFLEDEKMAKKIIKGFRKYKIHHKGGIKHERI